MSDHACQKTLRQKVQLCGRGVHKNVETTLRLLPAGIDTGIVFRRTDLPDAADIPARWDHVVTTQLCTVLGTEGSATVGTVEHLMSALSGAGVDNVLVELDGPEVPILDGSSAPFLELIDRAGIDEQKTAPRRFIRIKKTVSVTDGDSSASLSPGPGRIFSMSIEYADPAIGAQSGTILLANGAYRSDVAGARTFGFKHELDGLRGLGLALGASKHNAIAVDKGVVLNEEGLRYEDEFVRHKVLDAIGDLYLAGAPILGRFDGFRSGHSINNALLRALFADPDSHEVISGLPRDDRHGVWQSGGLPLTG